MGVCSASWDVQVESANVECMFCAKYNIHMNIHTLSAVIVTQCHACTHVSSHVTFTIATQVE